MLVNNADIVNSKLKLNNLHKVGKHEYPRQACIYFFIL